MLAPEWEEAGGKREEELMLLKGEYEYKYKYKYKYKKMEEKLMLFKGEWRWKAAENACQDQGGHLASIAI